MRKNFLAIFLLVATLLRPLPASATNANCPESWSLELGSSSGYLGFGFQPHNIVDKSGNLEKFKAELGFNLSITQRVEFSLDKTNWVTYQWPLILPDKSRWVFGPQSFYFLYPGFFRGVVKVEVKDCKSPIEFFTPSYASTKFVAKDNFSLEQVVGEAGDFKRAEYLKKLIQDDLKSSISNFKVTGKIKQSFPTDDSLVFLTPTKPGCMNFIGPFPGYWESNGKTCDFLLFGRQATIDGIKYSWADSSGNLTRDLSDLSKLDPVMFLVSKISLTSPPLKSTITCYKNGLVKKVVGKNPKCPAGYALRR